MYTQFFGLNEKPFSITPDPRYLFMSERHGEALAHLVYGVTESGGFIQLTGEVGTGKTTLVRTLLSDRLPDDADVAVVLNPQITAHEFLATICEELEVPVPDEKDSIKALTDALNQHLLAAHAAGRHTILIVDEAQNLAPAVLEQVRLLTNLETARKKLLQIILIGQPELRELLARTDLRQLAQRITGRYHLEPLTQDETQKYIEHRLRVAGALGEIFDGAAKKEVYRLSGGVPRLINVICDRALLGAYSRESRGVTKAIVRRAADEVAGERTRWPNVAQVSLGVAVIALIAAALFALSRLPEERTAPAEVTARQEVADPLPAAPPEPPPMPSLSEQLAAAGELTSEDFAFATLFRLWGIDFASGPRAACTQASDSNLACLNFRGSWNALRKLDRPAILNVQDESGTSHRIVLVAVNGDSAEVSIGGVRVTHSAYAIADAWHGQSVLLWRPPTGTPVSLAPGYDGPEVLWLRQSLADIDGRYRSNATLSTRYDSDLERIVREFQRDHRLDVDGFAGQHTQIFINSLLAADSTPRLTTPVLARE